MTTTFLMWDQISSAHSERVRTQRSCADETTLRPEAGPRREGAILEVGLPVSEEGCPTWASQTLAHRIREQEKFLVSCHEVQGSFLYSSSDCEGKLTYFCL